MAFRLSSSGCSLLLLEHLAESVYKQVEARITTVDYRARLSLPRASWMHLNAQLRRQVGCWDESKAGNQVTAGHMYSQPSEAKIGDGKFRATLGSIANTEHSVLEQDPNQALTRACGATE